MIPEKLRCEYLMDPLGIDTKRPRLSWVLESAKRGQGQTGYQVIVADNEEALQQDKGNLWDSGKINSKETINIVYDGEPLESGMSCFWKVRVWDGDGEMSAWSDPAFWEMALLNDGDWAGEWLNDGKSVPERDKEFYEDDPAPLFRKEFSISKEVKRARLYITGLGYYEASINGQRVGDHVLDPGWTNYSKRVLYSVYDVTDDLQRGGNCIGVMLGNGWYNPLPLRMWGRRNLCEYLPPGRPRFIAQLNIGFADGSSQSIWTDTSWKVHDGPILRNNVYLGEVYDARNEIERWDQPDLDDAAWNQAQVASEPAGRLQAQFQPPIKITATLKPVEITEPEPGTYIFDFGQNFAGWVCIRMIGTVGRTVRLRYGELLNVDGTLNVMTSVCGQIKRKKMGGPGSPEIAYQSDTYIAKGAGPETYTPRFTFRGFRYVELTGYLGDPTLESLEGLRLNTAVDEVGSFECSNDMLNRIQEITCWTFLSNIFSVQSDCPHREKFGYGGDIAVNSDAFMLNFDMANFYAKAVRDWHDAALPDGMLTDTAPFVGIQYCGVAWALAHPLLLYQLYQYYGNSRLLEEQYQTASQWLDLVTSQNPDHIIQDGLSDHEGLEEMPSPQMVTPLYHYSARLLSHLAGTLGLKDDQERYATLAQEIRDAYIQKFLEPGTGKIDPGTQASQAFALYLDLVPQEEKQAVADYLINRINDEHKGHLSTGIFGTKYLLHVLSELGYTDVAYSIVDQRSFPGWGFMLENDATTLWEHWDFSDNTYSHNHPMFGSVSEWFYRWLAGIQPHPDAAGFDRIIIKPQVVDGLNWVKSHYDSIRGRIVSEWRCENGRFTLDVTIPPNTSATVFIPAQDASNVTESDGPADSAEGVRFLEFDNGVASYEIGSGTYSFSHFTLPRGGC
ncbi:family 78 glycoside hydrolase catalytic domain [Candidatus Poribacteria bacterium]